MSDTSYRLYTGDVNKADLVEITRRPRSSALKSVLQWAMAVCVCFVMTVVLIRGAQPELTPKQIVQLDSYEGVQQVRKIFNLNSVRKDFVRPLRSTVPVAELAAMRVLSESEPGDSADVVLGGALPGIEVPAAAKVTNMPASTGKSVSDVLVSQVLPEPSFDRQMNPSDIVASRALPVYSVVVESVHLREAPSHDSQPVKSVSRAETVTLFSTRGQWFEVAANDGSGVTGFVPRSAVVLLKP